jgi:hypothetical protein
MLQPTSASTVAFGRTSLAGSVFDSVGIRGRLLHLLLLLRELFHLISDVFSPTIHQLFGHV